MPEMRDSVQEKCNNRKKKSLTVIFGCSPTLTLYYSVVIIVNVSKFRTIK
jgi:hypothetical protein